MNDTSATDLLVTLSPSEEPTQAVEACDVCTHPLSTHDRTAARYCDATQANALSRGCICKSV